MLSHGGAMRTARVASWHRRHCNHPPVALKAPPHTLASQDQAQRDRNDIKANEGHYEKVKGDALLIKAVGSLTKTIYGRQSGCERPSPVRRNYHAEKGTNRPMKRAYWLGMYEYSEGTLIGFDPGRTRVLAVADKSRVYSESTSLRRERWGWGNNLYQEGTR